MDFVKAMDRAYELFEQYAFRKRYSNNDWRKPLNKALFEVWSVILSKLQEEKYQILLVKKNKLNEEVINIHNRNSEFERAITTSTGSPKNVMKRFNEINDLINLVIK